MPPPTTPATRLVARAPRTLPSEPGFILTASLRRSWLASRATAGGNSPPTRASSRSTSVVGRLGAGGASASPAAAAAAGSVSAGAVAGAASMAAVCMDGMEWNGRGYGKRWPRPLAVVGCCRRRKRGREWLLEEGSAAAPRCVCRPYAIVRQPRRGWRCWLDRSTQTRGEQTQRLRHQTRPKKTAKVK